MRRWGRWDFRRWKLRSGAGAAPGYLAHEFGQCKFKPEDGGAEGVRTPDPQNAILVLYQLSYDPIQCPSMFEENLSGCKFKSSENRAMGANQFLKTWPRLGTTGLPKAAAFSI
jgi:hypothetical protein